MQSYDFLSVKRSQIDDEIAAIIKGARQQQIIVAPCHIRPKNVFDFTGRSHDSSATVLRIARKSGDIRLPTIERSARFYKMVVR